LNQEATFEVSADYDAPAASADGTYAVRIATNTLSATVEAGERRGVKLGSVNLKSGTFEIQVLPKKINGSELMRLRSVNLTRLVRD
jgi:hypothetical protein